MDVRNDTTTKYNFNMYSAFPHFIKARGCAGIFAVGTNLYTEKCSFKSNKMIYGGSFDNAHDVGVDVMLYNEDEIPIFWYTVNDCFRDWHLSTSLIGKGYIQFVNNSDCTHNDSYPITETYNVSIPKATSSNAVSKIETSSVPDPTSYTFVATPITKLPMATTQSVNFSHASIYTKTTKFSYIPSLERTPPPTLHTTPIQTPEFTLFPSTPLPTLKPNETESIIETLTQILTTTKIIESSSTLVETNITEYTLTNTTSSTTAEETLTYFETYINSTIIRKTLISQVTFYVVPTSIYIITNVTYITIIYVEDNTHASSMKSSTVILISAIVIASIFCLALIGITLYRKSRDAPSTSSTFEETADLDDDPERTMTDIHFLEDDTPDIAVQNLGEDEMFEPTNQSNLEDDDKFLHGDF
ncbi:hypothetical protein TVAG_048040 [Trichomonas vaginalis G3]|uniref:Uncharacterized protein n=1 Tax=Trichomonas vaginalis (strain ATCC PRA-98 / G3) TaxID=412133 RepID=A2EZI3_TRIV3|nr:hypothetical protein TVAGG3_0657600 [Trichomonas vaginalis G3]EAY01949.1 hypothetical protein TVAG_048040 [Trichomonas vaginalis G3]KAI5506277.1 hypothetical protein TVAGG3_0657600 [Trichomonas vaginalis G3]|eukprot:XP_001330464.1 hypothetical protein [Trichomonas vaginalis G3]